MPQGAKATTVWEVSATGRLERRQWPEASVIYDPDYGQTHLLDTVAATGLRCLEDEPRSEEALAREMARRLDVDADPRMRQYAAELIERLEALQLIERVP